MAIQSFLPIADYTYSGSWLQVPAAYPFALNVDDPIGTPDDVITYNYCTNVGYTPVRYFLFSFGTPTIPAGAVVEKVTITMRVHTEYQYSAVRTAVRVGGINYLTTQDPVSPPGGAFAWTTYAQDWLVNPQTGVAWTVDDVNKAGYNALQYFGISGVRTGFSDDKLYVTQVFLEIHYTEPEINYGELAASAAIAGELVETSDLSVVAGIEATADVVPVGQITNVRPSGGEIIVGVALSADEIYVRPIIRG